MHIKLLFIILLSIAGSTTASGQIVFGPGSEGLGERLDNIVAVVDDDIITRSELNQAMLQVERQLKQRNAQLPATRDLERQVLDRLILAQLQKRAIQRSGVVVDDQTVNAAIEQIAQRNKMGLSELRTTVERDGVSFAKFREDIRQDIALARLRQREIDSRIQISEQEVDNWLNRSRAADASREYHVAHILISLPDGASPESVDEARAQALDILAQLRNGADFSAMAVSVSDGRQALQGGDLGWLTIDQLPDLFANVVPNLRSGEVSNLIRSPSGFHIVKLLETKGANQKLVNQTRVRHILVRTDQTVSDEEARQRLIRLRERIVNGESFAELARAHSNDSISASRGGEIGWVSPGELVPAFENVMDRLAVGAISEPFQTQFGWHIAQVQDRRQQTGTDDAQRATVREALFKRKSDEEWELWLRRLLDEAYVEIRL